jgi:DNA-directed RNA polymerase specialized sigma24 family protein
MKAITILIRCRSGEGELRRIRQRIQQRREAAECITPRMDNVGGGRGTSEPDKIAAFVAAITELEAELNAREQARLAEVAAACVLLDALPESESAVLYQYYVKRQKAHAIAKKLGFTEGYIRKLKADGERLLEATPPEAVASALPAWYLRERPEGVL